MEKVKKKIVYFIWIFQVTYYTIYALINKTPGIKFHLFGQCISIKYLLQRNFSLFIKYWLNPISLFRFAEFQFIHSASVWKGKEILDISSPIMFSAYLCKKNKVSRATIFNPDIEDLKNSKKFFLDIEVNANQYNFLDSLDEVKKPFDIVYSISVIEHVVADEEKQFIENIWSFLRPGGLFVLTFPVAAKSRIEYRRENAYGLNVPRNKKGAYFYQRIYDDETINSRLIGHWKSLGGKDVMKSIFGFKTGFNFQEYIKRRRDLGFRETKADIIYASKFIKDFSEPMNLPDRGVCGLVLKKVIAK